MPTMNHEEAVRLKATEKYLLGELSAEHRDQFEEHYFGCAQCAQDVRAGATFIDNSRDVLRAGLASEAAKPESVRSSWWPALLRPAFVVPAFALLLLIAGYQNAITIPHLKAAVSQSDTAQTLPSFSLISENSRGGSISTIAVPEGKPFSLFLDIPPQGSYASYVCEFQNESGAAEFSVKVSADEAKKAVQLLVPGGRLPAGKQVLVVKGLRSPENPNIDKIAVATYPFSLEYGK